MEEDKYITLYNKKGECIKISEMCLETAPCQHYVELKGNKYLLEGKKIYNFLFEHEYDVSGLYRVFLNESCIFRFRTMPPSSGTWPEPNLVKYGAMTPSVRTWR